MRNRAQILGCSRLVLGLVGHFSAKHILERHAVNLNLPSNIDVEFLIAIPRSDASVGSWDYMQELIRRMTMDHHSASDSMFNFNSVRG